VLDGQEIRPCWVPVIALRGAAMPVLDAGDLPVPELITLETLGGADADSGRFWRDAER
jgi:hypothetical protein